jgi:hypothetical protein
MTAKFGIVINRNSSASINSDGRKEVIPSLEVADFIARVVALFHTLILDVLIKADPFLSASASATELRRSTGVGSQNQAAQHTECQGVKCLHTETSMVVDDRGTNRSTGNIR